MVEAKPEGAKPQSFVGDSGEVKQPYITPEFLVELVEHRLRDRRRAFLWKAGSLIIAIAGVIVGFFSIRLNNLDTEFESTTVNANNALSRVTQDDKEEQSDTEGQDTNALALISEGPIIFGLDTEFDEASRLEIIGTGFGSEKGSVELYYKVFLEDAETRPVTLRGEQITEWTDTRITAMTNGDQRVQMLGSLENGRENFEGLIPYIMITTADMRVSPLW